MDGARWAQRNVFDANPKANIRGFVVWFPMYRGDAKDRWHSRLLSDRRLLHRWDEQKAIGRFFLSHHELMRPTRGSGTLPKGVDALWDAWLLFDTKATWRGTMPDGLISWGATVLRTNQRLLEDLRTVSHTTTLAR